MQGPRFGNSTLVEAVLWFEHLRLGSLSTTIAMRAVGITGAMMLTGKVDVRRATAAIIGCFLLFGSPAISAGLNAMLTEPTGGTSTKVPHPPPQLLLAPASANPFDPYAGAAVPQQR
jgi:type IV secretory pathway VirB2 component (pilin)